MSLNQEISIGISKITFFEEVAGSFIRPVLVWFCNNFVIFKACPFKTPIYSNSVCFVAAKIYRLSTPSFMSFSQYIFKPISVKNVIISSLFDSFDYFNTFFFFSEIFYFKHKSFQSYMAYKIQFFFTLHEVQVVFQFYNLLFDYFLRMKKQSYFYLGSCLKNKQFNISCRVNRIIKQIQVDMYSDSSKKTEFSLSDVSMSASESSSRSQKHTEFINKISRLHGVSASDLNKLYSKIQQQAQIYNKKQNPIKIIKESFTCIKQQNSKIASLVELLYDKIFQFKPPTESTQYSSCIKKEAYKPKRVQQQIDFVATQQTNTNNKKVLRAFQEYTHENQIYQEKIQKMVFQLNQIKKKVHQQHKKPFLAPNKYFEDHQRNLNFYQGLQKQKQNSLQKTYLHKKNNYSFNNQNKTTNLPHDNKKNKQFTYDYQDELRHLKKYSKQHKKEFQAPYLNLDERQQHYNYQKMQKGFFKKEKKQQQQLNSREEDQKSSDRNLLAYARELSNRIHKTKQTKNDNIYNQKYMQQKKYVKEQDLDKQIFKKQKFSSKQETKSFVNKFDPRLFLQMPQAVSKFVITEKLVDKIPTKPLLLTQYYTQTEESLMFSTQKNQLLQKDSPSFVKSKQNFNNSQQKTSFFGKQQSKYIENNIQKQKTQQNKQRNNDLNKESLIQQKKQKQHKQINVLNQNKLPIKNQPSQKKLEPKESLQQIIPQKKQINQSQQKSIINQFQQTQSLLVNQNSQIVYHHRPAHPDNEKIFLNPAVKFNQMYIPPAPKIFYSQSPQSIAQKNNSKRFQFPINQQFVPRQFEASLNPSIRIVNYQNNAPFYPIMPSKTQMHSPMQTPQNVFHPPPPYYTPISFQPAPVMRQMPPNNFTPIKDNRSLHYTQNYSDAKIVDSNNNLYRTGSFTHLEGVNIRNNNSISKTEQLHQRVHFQKYSPQLKRLKQSNKKQIKQQQKSAKKRKGITMIKDK